MARDPSSRSAPLVLALLLGSACRHASPPPPGPAAPPPPVLLAPPVAEPRADDLPPQPVALVLSAGAALNPDEQGRSLPTLVRIYFLKSAGKLAALEADQLYRKGKEALGDDVLAVEEVLLSPGATARRTLARDKAAKVVAIVPLVRHPAGRSWRALAELPPASERCELSFRVEGYHVELRE